MNYMMDLTLILWAIFHHTSTPKGIRPLDVTLIDDAFDAHIEQETAHVHAEISHLDSHQDLFQNGTQYVQDLILGGRFGPCIHLPHRPAQIPRCVQQYRDTY